MAGSPDLRQLRYFVQVAEHGSFTRAAEALHVAQPAVSQCVRTLESELGARLLERGPRGVTLTDEGRRLLPEARSLLATVKSLGDRVRGEALAPEGEVVIGVGQTIGSLLMVPLIERARMQLPGVRIQVRELMSGLLPDLVRSGAVDFAINYNATSGGGLDVVTVMTEELCLVGQRRLAQRHLGRDAGPEIRFRKLAGIPLYLSCRTHILRELVERAASKSRVSINLVAEIDSLYIMRDLALGGTGFTVLSQANVRNEYTRHDLYVGRIVAPTLRRDICFVRRSDAAMPRAAREVARLAVEVLAALVKDESWKGVLRTPGAAQPPAPPAGISELLW